MPATQAPAEIYRTSTILAGLTNVPRASVFLRDKLFSKVVTAPTDQVDISASTRGRPSLLPTVPDSRLESQFPGNASNCDFSRTTHQGGPDADC
jgi:hypothetical protein